MSASFAVPDVLYERELRDYGREELVKLGLRVESLDGEGVALAMINVAAADEGAHIAQDSRTGTGPSASIIHL